MTGVERYQAADSYRGPGDARAAGPEAFPGERLALVDLLDRVLAGGVVITGEITLSVADVDLVVISLRALLTSVGALADQAVTADQDGQADPDGGDER